MKLTAKVKLKPTIEQARALLETIETANTACGYISGIAWAEKVFNQFKLHALVYRDAKERFSLTAQMVVRCISKVSDAYKVDKETRRTFRPQGAIAYDSRILRWYIDLREVSIWTTQGRFRIPFVAGKRQIELLQGQRGESNLSFIDGQFYLFSTCEVENPDPQDVEEFLGIDLGIVNIATDSDGETFAGNHLNSLRKRHSKLRTKLQSKGTHQAKRLLKKRGRKESRMAKHVNHVISKKIVEKAKDTGRGIALENLKGIRDRVTVRKASRRQHSSWAFFDLRAKIEYKARLAGLPLVAVDPRNTSRTCQVCGCVDKDSRKSQSSFLCTACGFASNADCNAAIIISRRAAVNRPYIPTMPATPA